MSVAQYNWASTNSMLSTALSALAPNHILIGGSGNTGTERACVGFPNSHPDVITVSATDINDSFASFSTYGNCVDFAAPGDDIYSASWADPDTASAFHLEDGTSFSTPLVSGIASLGLSIWPSMTQDDLYAALQASSVDLGAPGHDKFFGWGRVNAYATLDIRRTIFMDGFESGDTSAWDSSVP